MTTATIVWNYLFRATAIVLLVLMAQELTGWLSWAAWGLAVAIVLNTLVDLAHLANLAMKGASR